MPVIFITGRYRVEDFAVELKRDTHLFFRKPFDGQRLLDTVRKAVGRHDWPTRRHLPMTALEPGGTFDSL